MTQQSPTEHPTKCPIDLWSEDFNENFWPEINRLQADDALAVHTQGETPCYVATRYADVFKILRDWKRFSSEEGVAILGHDNRAEPPKNEGRFLPEDLDPPAQTDWRKLLNPELTEEKMRRFLPMITADIDALLDTGITAGRFRMMEDFLRPLQLRAVFSNLLNLDGDRIDDWMTWAHDIFVGETAEESETAFVSLYTAIDALVRERTAAPLEDDLVSLVCQVQEVGGREPTREERIAVVLPLSIAGLESTGTVLGGILHHLSTHPADLAEIVADPALIPDAIEEGLRMFANVTVLQRTTTCPVSVGTTDLPAGAKVWTSYNGANRDPQKFPDPHVWNLHRKDKNHIAFSIGPHRCLGSNFARVIMTRALERIVEKLPRFTLAADQPVHYHSMPTRGIHEFIVNVEA
ncbi:cytochrome P450 [Nocardia sp. CA2R105]|uniref:cytochrome P450 n=1 Tax=Nocardia coffeae TaxID=2873381 RepID=UPI001CA7A961|nr:cytochrome P450 [Nocardia coffeae]MBY8857110.1 cytochrome P450 [Nocardia coffeae]